MHLLEKVIPNTTVSISTKLFVSDYVELLTIYSFIYCFTVLNVKKLLKKDIIISYIYQTILFNYILLWNCYHA